MALTPAEFMSSLDEQLKTNPSRTQGVTTVFQFEISGSTGGSWYIEANDGTGAVSEGTSGDASLTVRMEDTVLVALATGEKDGTEAYFNGELTVEGDQSKMAYLGPLFGE